MAREGEASYKIEVKPSHLMGAHRGALKPYILDAFTDRPIPLYYHRKTVTDQGGTPDEGILEQYWVTTKKRYIMLFG